VAARRTIEALSESAKSIPLTRFLMYKFATRSHDLDLGEDNRAWFNDTECGDVNTDHQHRSAWM